MEAPEIVGYMNNNLVTKSDAPTQYTMVSVPFTGLENDNIMFDDITFENVVPGSADPDCDWIHIWYTAEDGDCGYYDFYQWVGDNQWYDMGDATPADYYPDGLPAGLSFWYEAICDDAEKGIERPGQLKITFAGAVENADDATFVLVTKSDAPTQYTMVSNPFPVAWQLEDTEAAVISGVVPGSADPDCDWIHIWYTAEDGDCGYYDFYQWVGDNHWYDMGDATPADYYPDGLPAGTAFWYEAICDDADKGIERGEDLTIKFFNPLKK